MTLLPEFPNTSGIVAGLVVSLIVNALALGLAVWALRDLNDYRKYHRAEMDKLREALEFVGILVKRGRGHQTVTTAMPTYWGGMVIPPVDRSTIKRGDKVWHESKPATVRSVDEDPKSLTIGIVKVLDGYPFRQNVPVSKLKVRDSYVIGHDEVVAPWLEEGRV